MTTVNSLGAQELAYLSGLSATQGYQVLNKNMAKAVTNFEKTPQAQSDITYFEQTIGTVKTVNQFLQNTRLVDFVLSAYGLDSEDNYQGLVRQVLTQDPNASGSLVNQLTDPRFKQLATALDFFDNGLGALQALGLPAPKTASSAEGVTLTSTASSTLALVASSAPAFTTTNSINSSISPAITVATSGSQYLILQEAAGTSNTIAISAASGEYLQIQEPDGSTGYTQSGSFTLNSSNQLALSDGSILQPALTFPTGTTSVNVTSTGEIDAFVNGSTTATDIGQLQTSTFTDPTQLTQDSNGYYTPTSGSGAATTAASQGAVSTAGATVYAQSGSFTVNSSGQLALADGTLLQTSATFPADTTSVTITSGGVIEANELGQTLPTVLAQLQTATFSNSSGLATDSLGYNTATTASGAATVNNSASGVATSNIISNLQTTVTKTAPPSGSTAFSVGIGVSGSDYLILQKADGTTAYAQSAYFSINSSNQLALPDGSLLFPPVVLPTGTTAVTVSSSGELYAQVTGSTTPTSVGQLETATFANAAQLAKDKNGYYTPTSASGTATTGFQSGKSFVFGSTIQNLVNNYVQNEFEIAVGQESSGVREALYFQRTIGPDETNVATYAQSTKADVILGDSVLVNVAETLLDQPAQIAYQSIASQEHLLESGLQLGNLTNTKYVASLTARYLALYDASNAAGTEASSSAALQILSAFSGGSSDSSSSSSPASTILSLVT